MKSGQMDGRLMMYKLKKKLNGQSDNYRVHKSNANQFKISRSSLQLNLCAYAMTNFFHHTYTYMYERNIYRANITSHVLTSIKSDNFPQIEMFI